MWYLQPTEKWIEDVVRLINERRLKPEHSRFMMAFFSSMDNKFVDYFKKNKEMISSVSGRNFHIFTPLIYEGNTIPDSDWRDMRNNFKELGVPIETNPTFIFFNLKLNAIKSKHSYNPEFFAGFICKSFTNFPNKLRNAIETCIETKNIDYLPDKLSEIFLSENILGRSKMGNRFKSVITRKLPKSRLFISYSHHDESFVKKFADELLKDSSTNVWIDEKEILAGDDIQQVITNTLQYKTDFFLLIISENSAKSSWVQFEVTQFIGFAEGRNIIPIMISKGQNFPEPIDNLIKRLMYLDFTDETKWQANIHKIKQAIEDGHWR